MAPFYTQTKKKLDLTNIIESTAQTSTMVCFRPSNNSQAPQEE